MKKIKLKVATLLTVCAILSTSPYFADSAPTLISLDKAQQNALAADKSRQQIDYNIKNINDQYTDTMEMKVQMEELLNSLNHFEQLHKRVKNKEVLDPLDDVQYQIYQAMFGDVPPEYTNETLYDKFIKNKEVPQYALYIAAENLKMTRQVVEKSIVKGVETLYFNMLDLEDGIAIQKALLTVKQNGLQDQKLQFEKGLMSVQDYQSAQTQVEIQKLQVEKLQNTMKTLKNTLNQLMGSALSQDFSVNEPMLSVKRLDIQDYEVYEGQALKARNEILSASLSKDQYSRENALLKQYKTNANTLERFEAELKEVDAIHQLSAATDQVKADVYKAYLNARDRVSSYRIAVDASKLAAKQLDMSTVTYKMGLMTKGNLDQVQMQYDISVIQYNQARRQYVLAMKQLEDASSFGPAFTQEAP